MRTAYTGLLMVVILLAAVAFAWGKGPQGVQHTKHNLAASGPDDQYRSNNYEAICVFCHTPHGGNLGASGSLPLWNRSNPDAAKYLHYNSSTLSAEVGSATRNVNDESLICLSCHDGSIAVNRILNASNSAGGVPVNDYWGGETFIEPLYLPGNMLGAQIGNSFDYEFLIDNFRTDDLRDDHPISFSYHDVYNKDAQAAAKLHTIAEAEASGVRFFGPDQATGKRVECSSCHDPHVNYVPANGGNDSYAPFLIMSNSGSKLCLACHDK